MTTGRKKSRLVHATPSGKRNRIRPHWRRLRLCHELLEPRYMLAASLDHSVSVPRPISWFESFDDVPRIATSALDQVDEFYPNGFIGPKELAAGEWIVQLSDQAANGMDALIELNDALDDEFFNDFTVINGLGSRGLVLLRGVGLSRTAIESSLARSDQVKSFSLNSVVRGQLTEPSDPDYVARLMDGLEVIGAPEAWDVSRGDMQTVVGVVDSGVDITHPDLYLNIWINQGEIPAAIFDQLTDIDGDGLITFYDLNHVEVSPQEPYSLVPDDFADGDNRPFVTDFNGNGYIDGFDLRNDPRWGDGLDGDQNDFVDDLVGANFRSDVDDGGTPLDPSDDVEISPNNPADLIGHGTHVAGTIGAIGGNEYRGVGVNWRVSIMPLRILDNQNQSDAAAALTAINYARSMRERLKVETVQGQVRTTEGANVRVLNNSWGQPGGYEAAFETALDELGDAGVLFVAAAGNGNVFGEGVNNDDTPFYPASYESANVISVAASTGDDLLALFSNYGRTSVDLAAPGVGILSTDKDGGYATRNGTSMAAPHVAGTAALIWAALPQSTVDEVKEAILSTTQPIRFGELVLATGTNGGRLSADGAIHANVFAPTVRLADGQMLDVTTPGGTATRFTVEFRHPLGIDWDASSKELRVVKEWGNRFESSPTLDESSVQHFDNDKLIVATYELAARGGSWHAFDFGDYVISSLDGTVVSKSMIGEQPRPNRAESIGQFRVQIADPNMIYVQSFSDVPGTGSLRDAIIQANAAFAAGDQAFKYIVLEDGTYTIDIPHDSDPLIQYPDPDSSSYCDAPTNATGWSNETTGDFDLMGRIYIAGANADRTIIDAQGLDRVFKIHPSASVAVVRVTVTGGVSPPDQGGGGILSTGGLTVQDSIIRDNLALAGPGEPPIRGGGLAVWSGPLFVQRTWITGNESHYGGGVFVCESNNGTITQSTLDNNIGGGLHSHSHTDLRLENSTFSANSGGRGAIFNGSRDGFDYANAASWSPSISDDGRFVVFASDANNIVPGDSNGVRDIFLHDRLTGDVKRISVAQDGTEPFNDLSNPMISGNGNVVVFESYQNNLVPEGSRAHPEIFVYHRDTDTLSIASVNSNGEPANSNSYDPAVSADGNVVAFWSRATNLDVNIADTNSEYDLFTRNLVTGVTERVSYKTGGGQAEGSRGDLLSRPSLSADGRFIAYNSWSSDLTSGDNLGILDIFVVDTLGKVTDRVVANTPSGVEDPNDISMSPTISADGQFVAFTSRASNLVEGDSNGAFDIFGYDRQASPSQRLTRLSVDANGDQVYGNSYDPSIFADGKLVAFASLSDDFDATDTNSEYDIFVKNWETKEVDRITSAGSFTQSNPLGSFYPMISGNGQFVVFESDAQNLVLGDADPKNDIFVHELNSNSLTSVTVLSPPSTIQTQQVTIANTTGADFAISGGVALKDALLANNFAQADFGNRVVAENSLNSTDANVDLLGPLTRFRGSPPIHPVLAGNPAIDAGTIPGGIDQLGNLRGASPDIGAHEATSATATGSVFVDLNQNQKRDPGEPGLPGVTVVSQYPDATTTTVTSDTDDRATIGVNEAGAIRFDAIAPGQTEFFVQVPQGWSFSRPAIRRIQPDGIEPDNTSSAPSLSRDGRFIAFESAATNWIGEEDTNGDSDPTRGVDVFVFDRVTGAIERISVDSNENQSDHSSSDPSISGDGNYVAFESRANLDPRDSGNSQDIYLRDRARGTTVLVSVNASGVASNAYDIDPVINSDGNVIVFRSSAMNLYPGFDNGKTQVYFYSDTSIADGFQGQLEPIMINGTPVEADDSAFETGISGDGNTIVFRSNASNLVGGISGSYVYSYQRDTDTLAPITPGSGQQPAVNADGSVIAFGQPPRTYVYDDNSASSPETYQIYMSGTKAVSDDGRFIAFSSFYSNLVEEDTNNQDDVFVLDRTDGTIVRVSVDRDGNETRGPSSQVSMSGDGRFIAFASDANNLVPSDSNRSQDVFVVANPLADPVMPRAFQIGDAVMDLDLGLVPNPGLISGRVYVDEVANGVFDSGEPTRSGWTVYLDTNANGRWDESEASTITDVNGEYLFDRVPAHRDQRIAVSPPPSWEQVTPGQDRNFVWDVFLPAGGEITGRDFGFKPISGTGQSRESVISGRVLQDADADGEFDDGAASVVVYIDADNDGRRDLGSDEPTVVTDSQGYFEFTNLGSRIAPVRTELDTTMGQVFPLGNRFTPLETNLYPGQVGLAEPQAVASADFNRDGYEDIAVLVSDRNQLAIRYNDSTGQFPASSINIDLAESPGVSLPKDLVVGQFNGADTGLDVAIVGFSSNNVLVLLDYDSIQDRFATRHEYPVGVNPIAIATGDFNVDGSPDIAVVNRGVPRIISFDPEVYEKDGDESVQLLFNNGAGAFDIITSIVIPVTGDNPSGLVVADFDGQMGDDLAVLHPTPINQGTPFGHVALFHNDGAGNLTEYVASDGYYPVKAIPVDMITADFNGDGRPDVAVANAASNSITILTGTAAGRLLVDPIVIGTVKGVDSMAVADLENDGDFDIVTSRLDGSSTDVAIFRNTTAPGGALAFEPLEAIGLADLAVANRSAVVVADFDKDTSATTDIVVIPRSTQTVNVLLNTLVGGAHRVALDGTNTVSDLEILIGPVGDVTSPVITDVRVAGSLWPSNFKSAVDPVGLRGFALPGPNQLQTLPWINLDTLYIEFSEDVQKAGSGTINAADLTLTGVNVADYESVTGYGITTSYSNGGGDGPFLLTIGLAGQSHFTNDRLTLTLADTIVDLAGNSLDGEWTDAVSSNSGDSTRGGDFVFHFNVLPGDVDNSGGVLTSDVLTVNASQFTFAGGNNYNPRRDVDASGSVLSSDVLLTNVRQFTFLPSVPSGPPSMLAEGEPVPISQQDNQTSSADGDFDRDASLGEGEAAQVPGIKLYGEVESFTGPGTYVLDMFVEAVGGPVSIAGFNAPLLIDVPGVQFAGDDSAFTPNSSFDLEFVTGLGTPGAYGVAGSLGSGLQLALGESAILFSIELVVDAGFEAQPNSDVVRIITEGAFASALQFNNSALELIEEVTIESAARIIVPVPPTILLNSLSVDPADRPIGVQPSSWITQRSQIRDIVIELQTPISELPSGGISLTHLGVDDGESQSAVDLRSDQVSLDATGKVISILLDPDQLPDGQYRLDLSQSITSGLAYAWSADEQNRFFVLRGDWDGNSSVDVRDLATFAYWAGVSSGAPDYVNDDGIGGITIEDLVGFEANFPAKLDVPGLTDAVDPNWVDPEVLQHAKATLINPTDVNGNGEISPVDALSVINRIAAGFISVTDWRFDVNRDGSVSPQDALFVINRIARDILLIESSSEAAVGQAAAQDSSEDPLVSDAATVVLDLVGQRQTYSGPGQYTFEFLITAIGGDQIITGFSLPLRFDVPGVTFGGTVDDFTPNPAFNFEFVAPLSQSNHFGVAGSSGGAGLAIGAGLTEVLFSVDVDVSASVDLSSPVELAIPITEGDDAQGLQFIGSGIQAIEPPNFLRGAVLAPSGPQLNLAGSVREFTGAGNYTLDFTAEAVGGPLSIAGFNAPVVFDVPGVSFAGDESAFTPNEVFVNEFVTALASPNTYGVAATLGTGLQLEPGERAILFSIDVIVDPTAAIDSAEDVARILTSGNLANSLQFIDPDARPILDVFVASAAVLARAIVPQVTVNDGSSTRSQITSLTVTFDALVDHDALDNAFRLTNLDSGSAVGTIHVSATDVGTQTNATLTFDGVSTINRQGSGILGISLADGNYRLEMLADYVHSENGQQMFRDQRFGENATDLLFRLFGDSDGDRDVDGQDYGRFGLSFLAEATSPGYDPGLDSDGDGDVDGVDYGNLGRNFLKSLGSN